MEASSDDYAWKLWRVRRVAHEICVDRGYNIAEGQINMTMEDLNDLVPNYASNRENLRILVEHRDDPSNQLYVFFPQASSVSVRTIEEYVETMSTNNVKRAIIILKSDITPFARQSIAATNAAMACHIELFKEEELLVNITKHELVPRHTVLTDEEKKALLDRYKLKDSQLPRITARDPVARYYGLKRGQVVKIVRPSETAGRYTTYRIVI